MQTITSKEVAEMLEKRHDNLLRAIRKYISTLGADANSYFMQDPDKGDKVYLISKAGCDLMAGRIIGEKSEAFKSKYLPLFGEDAEPKKDYVKPVIEPVPKAYTVEEVATLLGMSERTVYRNIQAGKLEAEEREIMVPTYKKFVTQEALEAFKVGRAG